MADLASRREKKAQQLLNELKKQNNTCMDCKSTHTQYIVMDFATWVCATCGGIHREFGHKIRPINASSFKPDELAAISSGGNRAAQLAWRALWTAQQCPMPDGTQPLAAKEFIRQTYVQRRWLADSGAASDPRGSSARSPQTSGMGQRRVSFSDQQPPVSDSAADSKADDGPDKEWLGSDFLQGVLKTRNRTRSNSKRFAQQQQGSSGHLPQRSQPQEEAAAARASASGGGLNVAPATSTLSSGSVQDTSQRASIVPSVAATASRAAPSASLVDWDNMPSAPAATVAGSPAAIANTSSAFSTSSSSSSAAAASSMAALFDVFAQQQQPPPQTQHFQPQQQPFQPQSSQQPFSFQRQQQQQQQPNFAFSSAPSATPSWSAFDLTTPSISSSMSSPYTTNASAAAPFQQQHQQQPPQPSSSFSFGGSAFGAAATSTPQFQSQPFAFSTTPSSSSSSYCSPFGLGAGGGALSQGQSTMAPFAPASTTSNAPSPFGSSSATAAAAAGFAPFASTTTTQQQQPTMAWGPTPAAFAGAAAQQSAAMHQQQPPQQSFATFGQQQPQQSFANFGCWSVPNGAASPGNSSTSMASAASSPTAALSAFANGNTSPSGAGSGLPFAAAPPQQDWAQQAQRAPDKPHIPLSAFDLGF